MRKLKVKQCQECGQEFQPIGNKQKWCSLACRIEGEYIVCPTGCWIWTGQKTQAGYGVFGWQKRKMVLAHRVSYELENGPIANGLHVLHRCDVPLCIRPEHLFLGTQADNMADMKAKGRSNNGVHIGEANGRAKLTNANVAEIRNSSDPIKEIAANFGVSKSTIFRVKSGKGWAHI